MRSTHDESPGLRPIFIGGCQRSGTTMLGALLGVAPGAMTVPESGFRFAWHREIARGRGREEALRALLRHRSFLSWLPLESAEGVAEGATDYVDILSRLIQAYASEHGIESPRVWVDHTPQNAEHGLRLVQIHPKARFVHLVRDGRAVAASVMPLSWGPNTPCRAAAYWQERVGHGLALETSAFSDRVIRVRYEDLLTEPEPTLRRLCDHCGLEFVPEMLSGGRFDVPRTTQHQHRLVGAPPNTDRLTAWERSLAPRQVELFEASATPLLTALGYEPRFGLTAQGARRGERMRLALLEAYREKVTNPRRKKELRRRFSVR